MFGKGGIPYEHVIVTFCLTRQSKMTSENSIKNWDVCTSEIPSIDGFDGMILYFPVGFMFPKSSQRAMCKLFI